MTNRYIENTMLDVRRVIRLYDAEWDKCNNSDEHNALVESTLNQLLTLLRE